MPYLTGIARVCTSYASKEVRELVANDRPRFFSSSLESSREGVTDPVINRHQLLTGNIATMHMRGYQAKFDGGDAGFFYCPRTPELRNSLRQYDHTALAADLTAHLEF